VSTITSAEAVGIIWRKYVEEVGIPSWLAWFKRIFFIMRSWILDATYYTISIDELLSALEVWRTEVLSNLHYVQEVFDCDDFADYFKVWIQKYFSQKGKLVNCVGRAYGYLYHGDELLGGHAWNIVLVNNGSSIDAVFVEPQIGEIIGSESPDGYKYKLMAVII